MNKPRRYFCRQSEGEDRPCWIRELWRTPKLRMSNISWDETERGFHLHSRARHRRPELSAPHVLIRKTHRGYGLPPKGRMPNVSMPHQKGDPSDVQRNNWIARLFSSFRNVGSIWMEFGRFRRRQSSPLRTSTLLHWPRWLTGRYFVIKKRKKASSVRMNLSQWS